MAMKHVPFSVIKRGVLENPPFSLTIFPFKPPSSSKIVQPYLMTPEGMWFMDVYGHLSHRD